jgi:hypothetical protein
MEEINAHKISIRDLKRLLRRPRRRWEDNIRMYLMGIGWKVVDWIHLAQDKDQ